MVLVTTFDLFFLQWGRSVAIALATVGLVTTGIAMQNKTECAAEAPARQQDPASVWKRSSSKLHCTLLTFIESDGSW